MKKSLIALSVLAAASAVAFADSNVTLYGKIDMGPAVAKTKGSAAKASLDSGNYMGSRWGIRGVEDLGGGNAVGFQLEQGVNADTGNAASSSRAFHRISRLYVKGGWGEVGFGRWGTLSSGTGPYEMLSPATWLNDGATSFTKTNAWDTIAGNPGRANNSIIYVSPNFAGLTLSAMYSNETDGDDTAQWSKNHHYYGVGGVYKAGNLAANLIFEVRDSKGNDGTFGKGTADGWAKNTRNFTVTNSSTEAIYNINFGIAYDFGLIRPQLGYAWARQSDIASQHTFGLSATSPIAGGKLVYGARYLFGKYEGAAKTYFAGNDVEDKYRLLTINLFYDYPLSKRTEVYGYAGWTKGSKAWSKTGEFTDVFNGGTINTNGYAVQLGMVHNF